MKWDAKWWPTREQWAYRQQHPYWDGETGCPFAGKYSHRLSDYATAEEIAALTAALKDLYRELGRDLRTANLQAASLKRQPGESSAAQYQRSRIARGRTGCIFQSRRVAADA
jgi:hypothetical protein